MMEGVNSTVIYCKNFCKCHSVPPSTIRKKKMYEKEKYYWHPGLSRMYLQVKF
jgi:hypothetical protein